MRLWGFAYVTMGDDRVRVNHEALDGTKARKDDPIWNEITPPLGWNCRCQKIEEFDPDTTEKLPPAVEEVDGVIVVPGPDPKFDKEFRGVNIIDAELLNSVANERTGAIEIGLRRRSETARFETRREREARIERGRSRS